MNSTFLPHHKDRRRSQSRLRILITLFLTGIAISAFSQSSQSITGRITARDTGEGLPGVNVVVKGTTSGTITDVNGNFTLNAAPNATLLVSSIGYKTNEVPIDSRSNISLALEADVSQLQELVVVGYDTRDRKDVVGSISKIDPADIRLIPQGSFDAQLQGKIAGVQISSNTGVPGEVTNVRIRGVTSINADVDPLYVIDGVFVNSNSLQTVGTGGKATSPLADLNPSDIESVEVLKDAAATALFGSRGANGVIIVTTKRGSYEQRPTLDVNISHGWTKAAKLWDLTTGPEHAQLVNEWWINTGLDNPSLNRTFENRPFRPVSEVINGQPGRGLPEEQQTYDRLGEIFRTAQVKNYDVSLRGGSSSTRYYVSAGYNNQESILKPIEFERATFKLNLDQKINDRIQTSFTNSISRTHRNQARAGDGPAGGLLQAALHTPTYLSPYNEEGQLVGRAGFDNVTLLIEHYDVNSVSLRYVGNINLEAEILPNLKVRSSWGADYNQYDESEYWNTFLISGSPNGLATSSVTRNSVLLNEQVISYRKHFGRHELGVLVGNTLQSDVTDRTYAEGRGFANNSVRLISQASSLNASQSWTKSTLTSFFTRLDYNFGGKYLFDATFRADGSSRFGKNNRWGYFPAVGAAWRIKEEGFLRDVNTISDLKLRGSFGLTGNQAIGDFAGQGLWSAGTGYEGQPGIAVEQLANPNLKWEETTQYNLGIDVAVLQNRLRLEANFYDKYTRNGLVRRTVPATTGFNAIWDNAIEISNKGFELGLHAINISNSVISWTTDFNIARNINRIEKLDNPMRYGSRDLILQQEGYPLYSFWVYKELGVDPQTGNVIYDDVDGVPGITVADRQIAGDVWPKFFGGMSNSITIGHFDINAFFSFQYGNKIYNHNRFFGEGGGARDAARIIFAHNNKRWQKPGDITDVPRPDGININNYRDGGSRWLEDGSFLRLRNLTVGYSLSPESARKLRVSHLRVYAQGTNLWLLTRYTGLDPESSASSSQNEPGIDLGTPPQPRGFQIGLEARL